VVLSGTTAPSNISPSRIKRFACPSPAWRGSAATKEPTRMRLCRREKDMPLDKNAKARVMAYAMAWTALHRQPGSGRSDDRSVSGFGSRNT
jgi:hypothetical protein